MAFGFGTTSGASFVSAVVASEIYDPVYDTEMDPRFIWQLLPSFYRDLMEDQDIQEILWSGVMQGVAADLLNLWQIDYAKSSRDVPIISQRKWIYFDFLKDINFVRDPELNLVGFAVTFPYALEDQALGDTWTNRAGVDKATRPLLGPTEETGSLEWSFEARIDALDKQAGMLVGYYSSESVRQQKNSLTAGILGDVTLADSPRVIIHHTSPVGAPVLSASSFLLKLGVDYSIESTYTARTGIVVTEVHELDAIKVSGTGDTTENLGEVYTTQFIDLLTNFDVEGVLAGDILLIADERHEILSVDGFVLSTRTATLPVDTEGLAYEVRGKVFVDSLSLDLPGDSPDPRFVVDTFGTSILDIRAIPSTVFPEPGKATRKAVTGGTTNWTYFDPTVEEIIIALPRLQDTVTDPDTLLYGGTDYVVNTSRFLFQEPPAGPLWAEYVGYDEAFIENNFGANVGLREVSSATYKARVRGLYFSFFKGPTLESIRRGVHILLGLPIAEEAGVVESINPAFSGIFGQITVSGRQYLYPLVVGTSLVVGDEVGLFEPLCDGVEITDYINSDWWVQRPNFYEIQKYHTFQVSLNADAFDEETFVLAANFVKEIKPTWKDESFIVFKNLIDDVDMDDFVSIAITLNLYDTPCDVPAVLYDDPQYADPTAAGWSYDQGETDWDGTSAAMRETAVQLTGQLTLANGATVITGVGTNLDPEVGPIGPVLGKRLAMGRHHAGLTGETTTGSHVFTDLSANFLLANFEVEADTEITIQGVGVFEILSVDSAVTLTLAAPMPSDGTGLTWDIVGKFNWWAEVTDVNSDTELVFDVAVDVPGNGNYDFALLDNNYRKAYYDWFTEVCPDERLGIIIEYTNLNGGGPYPNRQVPAADPTMTGLFSFNNPGDTYSVTLDELTP
jgi:hypothetical protein